MGDPEGVPTKTPVTNSSGGTTAPKQGGTSAPKQGGTASTKESGTVSKKGDSSPSKKVEDTPKKTIKADGEGTKSKPEDFDSGKVDSPKKGISGKAKTIAGGAIGGYGVGKAVDAMGGDEPPAEEKTPEEKTPEEGGGEAKAEETPMTEEQKAMVAQGQELAQAKMQNAIDKENGVVDFDDPRELQALQMGLPDTVKSGTRVLPNRLKQNLQASTRGAMIRQQQKAKNDRRKQATIDHNATTMLEDPNIANIEAVYDKTGGRSEGSFDALSDAQKQQMVRNYYMNETNASQRRQKIQDLAGEDALVGNIYKDGKKQAGDVNYASNDYFDQKKGFTKDEFTKGTGLENAGTGMVGTNLEDTVNEGRKETLEMGDRFEQAGGEASAQPFLTDSQKQNLMHQNARPGEFTDQFGQKSAMNEDTRRISSDKQDYGDASFDSPEKALAYLNRSKEDAPEAPEEEPEPQAPPPPVDEPEDGGQGVVNPNSLLPIAMSVLSRGKVKPKAKSASVSKKEPSSFDTGVPKNTKTAQPKEQPAQPVKTPAPQPTYKTMDGRTRPIPKVERKDPMKDPSLPKNPMDLNPVKPTAPAPTTPIKISKDTGLPATTPRAPSPTPSATPTKPRAGIFDTGVPKSNPKENMKTAELMLPLITDLVLTLKILIRS